MREKNFMMFLICTFNGIIYEAFPHKKGLKLKRLLKPLRLGLMMIIMDMFPLKGSDFILSNYVIIKLTLVSYVLCTISWLLGMELNVYISFQNTCRLEA